MSHLSTNSQVQRTFKRIIIIAEYFFSEGRLLPNLKKHFTLAALLKSFKATGLIGNKTFVIYLFSYLSRSFSTNDKLHAVYFHYSFLKKRYPAKKLNTLFLNGLEVYREQNGEDVYTIVLAASHLSENEGSLALNLRVNGNVLAVLSFSFIRGKLAGVKDKAIIYVCRSQRMDRYAESAEKVKSQFNDILPVAILLKVLEALSLSLGINSFACVSADNQPAFWNLDHYDNFCATYDEFWKLNGGIRNGGNFIIPLPLYQKDIMLVKQTHRNRVRKKRQKLQEIFQHCHHYFLEMTSDR